MVELSRRCMPQLSLRKNEYDYKRNGCNLETNCNTLKRNDYKRLKKVSPILVIGNLFASFNKLLIFNFL